MLYETCEESSFIQIVCRFHSPIRICSRCRTNSLATLVYHSRKIATPHFLDSYLTPRILIQGMNQLTVSVCFLLLFDHRGRLTLCFILLISAKITSYYVPDFISDSDRIQFVRCVNRPRSNGNSKNRFYPILHQIPTSLKFSQSKNNWILSR